MRHGCIRERRIKERQRSFLIATLRKTVLNFRFLSRFCDEFTFSSFLLYLSNDLRPDQMSAEKWTWSIRSIKSYSPSKSAEVIRRWPKSSGFTKLYAAGYKIKKKHDWSNRSDSIEVIDQIDRTQSNSIEMIDRINRSQSKSIETNQPKKNM